MSIKFFKTLFAQDGDKTAVPNGVQGDGSVSYDQGYGPDYEADPDAPGVLYPERDKFNDLLYNITAALQLWQVHAFPDWITSSDNGGSSYSYDKNAFVRYSNLIYYSLVDTNTATPGSDDTKWALWSAPSPFQTGMTIIHEDTNLPSGGWVWANGQTIGDASSNATGRANADTSALFTQIWTAFPNSVRPILNSNGSAGTRGVSAAADFAAHKALPLRDMRCVVPAGTATMGGASNRGLLTGYRQGVDASVFGATGGEQEHTPILDEMYSHNHTVLTNTGDSGGAYIPSPPRNSQLDLTLAAINGRVDGPFSYISTSQGREYIGSVGSGQDFNVVQPTTICNYITKL